MLFKTEAAYQQGDLVLEMVYNLLQLTDTNITRSSAVAVIADRTACKVAVRTPLHVHRYTAALT